MEKLVNGDIMAHQGGHHDGLDSFLFTSESVGEGHPGKMHFFAPL